MRRPMKKGVAFLLATTLLLGSFSTSAMAAEATENEEAKVTTLAEAVYDEAVTFTESVAFLENGNWSDGGGYEYTPDTQQGNVSTKTKVVFMDENGNKTTLLNKDSSGDTLFDAIYPMISGDMYQFDALKIIKEGKISYIKADGSYYGSDINFYNYAIPINDEFLLISENGKNYSIINSEEKVIFEGIEFLYPELVVYNVNVFGELISIEADNKTYIFNTDGKLLYEYEPYTCVYSAGKGYVSIHFNDKTYLMDLEGNIVKEINAETYGVDTTYLEQGYLCYRAYIREENSGTSEYQITDFKTGEVLYQTYSTPHFDGNVIVDLYSRRNVSVRTVDGEVLVENLDQIIVDIADEKGYQSVSYESYYVNGSLLISMIDKDDTSKTDTAVFTKENGFAKEKVKVIGGLVAEFTYDDEYFMTTDYDGYIRNMCTIDGTLVKSYGDNTTYRNPWKIYKYYSIYGNYYHDVIPGFAFEVSTDNGKTTYIKSNGDVGSLYTSIRNSSNGNFLIADGDTVINTSYKEVYKAPDSEVEIRTYWYADVFCVIENGLYSMYDRDGNRLISQNAGYDNIGSSYVNGGYWANENDHYGMFHYTNSMLENGLCVVRTCENGTYKYGLIKVAYQMKDGFRKGADGKWYYYKNGVVDTKYTGMAKNEYGWWYVNKGKLDTTYTGLAQYNKSWVYVSKGKLDTTYTGLVKYKDSWVYVSKGKLDATYTGLVKYNKSWVYVSKGKLDATYTGLAKNQYGWWHVTNGKLDLTYTGMSKNQYGWWYVNKGKLDLTYTGMAKNQYGWWHMTNGKLDLTYTGLSKNQYGWWYVNKGKLDLTYTGKVEYKGVIFNVEKGKLVK